MENTIKKTIEEAVKKGADLRRANLRGANLWEADLRGANLWEADNVPSIFKTDLYILKAQPGKLRAYKFLNGDKSPYQNFKYEVGKTYTADDCDDNELVECSRGINVATLDWCLRRTNGDLTKTYIEVEFLAKDIVAIPYFSDGKFRVRKVKALRKLNKKELKEYLKPINESKVPNPTQ
ncbi:MAG: pentapeptide repeat-containing protein [Nanoarchaeota archaeon]|nr:pentapeptide repeat-containing protein [Nanoarchaeota archaeon]